MKSSKFYEGKEQTYLKHFILENYLKKLCYTIGYSWNIDVCFVDCFAGPWETECENYEDSSIKISLDVLKKVKKGLAENNRYANFKAVYLEKDPDNYQTLSRILKQENEIQTVSIHGKFENKVDEILRETNNFL